jgi:hypothetical protein
MIDPRIDELLDESVRLQWLERHLHPYGLAVLRVPAAEAQRQRVRERPARRPSDYRRQRGELEGALAP